MGCARDIVESAGVPRFWWSDFPLGHSAGKPGDVASQRATVEGALALFDSATEANTTVASEQRWAADDRWQDDFMDLGALSSEQIEKLKRQHEHTRATKAQLTAKG